MSFLQSARSDRFFALWVLEATSGMRRCELAGAWRFASIVEAAGLPKIRLQDVRHGYATAGRDAKIDWKV